MQPRQIILFGSFFVFLQSCTAFHPMSDLCCVCTLWNLLQTQLCVLSAPSGACAKSCKIPHFSLCVLRLCRGSQHQPEVSCERVLDAGDIPVGGAPCQVHQRLDGLQLQPVRLHTAPPLCQTPCQKVTRFPCSRRPLWQRHAWSLQPGCACRLQAQRPVALQGAVGAQQV